MKNKKIKKTVKTFIKTLVLGIIMVLSLFNVNAQVKSDPSLSNFNAITKNYFDGFFTINPPMTLSSGVFTYTSSNTAVATISGSKVTIVGLGVTTITATQAADVNYLSNSIVATLIVNSENVLTKNGLYSNINASYIDRNGKIGGGLGLSKNGAIKSTLSPDTAALETSTKKKIIITFDAPPTTLNVNTAYYKYDKTFAFSLQLDDQLIGQYNCAIPLFNGGTVVYKDGNTPNYAGLFYTDGCGNNIPFSSSLAINMGFMETSSNPTSKMNAYMLRNAYIKNFVFVNHSFTHRTQFESPFWDADPTIRNQQILAQINDNYNLMLSMFGVKIMAFAAPSNDAYYDPIALELINSKQLKTATNVNNPSREYAHSSTRTAEYWRDKVGLGLSNDYATVIESNLKRTVSDFAYIDTKLASVGTQHAWFSHGIHDIDKGEAESVPGAAMKYLTFKYFMEGLQSRYGKTGVDNMWMAPINSIYEYLICARDASYTVVKTGNTAEISFNFGSVDPDFLEHALSLVVNSNANVVSIVYQGFDKTSHKINYKGLGDNNALINLSYKPENQKEVYSKLQAYSAVETVEKTSSQTDFNLAQGYITALASGSYKDDLQTRLNLVTPTPDSQTVRIDFGRNLTGYTSAFPWNNVTDTMTTNSMLTNMTNTVSNSSGLNLQIIAPFGGYDANVPFTISDTGLPFPFEACRDVLKVNANTTATLQLQNCNPTKLYDFVFYAYRGFVGNVSQITIGTTTVNVAHKTDGYVTKTITNVAPINGIISINIKGDGANSGYIGVIQVTEK